MIYSSIIRPFLFRIDPEEVHKKAIKFLAAVSQRQFWYAFLQRIFFIDDVSLHTRIGSIALSNPVGLSAGFDKNIEAPLAYPMLGFGFAEMGSITYHMQPGNARPRLWRLPKDKGLIVYYGLANDGVSAAKKKLEKIGPHKIPYGISIAPTTGLDLKDMAKEYVASFEAVAPLVDYVVFNISCPNVTESDMVTQVSFIRELIETVAKTMREKGIQKDWWVKVGVDAVEGEIDEIVDICIANKVTGIISANLIKCRTQLSLKSAPEELNHPGGISGAVLSEKSNNIIRRIYRRAQGKLQIIGVGGIFTAEDAYEKIRCGASAVQLITGFVYGGPFSIKKINKGLVRLLKRDGYANIQEAVGGGVTEFLN